MTLEQKKQIACAELDGWKFIKGGKDNFGVNYSDLLNKEHVTITFAKCQPYATSLDAIVPVVVKWCGEDIERWFKFRDALEVGESSMMVIQYYLSASPTQIRDALLLAAGKMPEEDDK